MIVSRFRQSGRSNDSAEAAEIVEESFEEVSKGASGAKVPPSAPTPAPAQSSSGPKQKPQRSQRKTLEERPPFSPPQRTSGANKAQSNRNTEERAAIIVLEAKEGLDFIETYKAIRTKTNIDQHVARACRTGERKMSLWLKPSADCEDTAHHSVGTV